MSQRLPAVTGQQVCRAFERLAWKLARIEGSHHVYVNEELRRAIPIPVHAGRNIGRGLLTKILRDAGIDRDSFLRALRGR